MRFEILTVFPSMITDYVSESILGKAREKGLLEVTATDVRDYATNKHRNTDDTPYGGGAGMVMKVESLVGAIEAAKARLPASGSAILVCGRYEGIDERALAFVDEELSLGDFVLTGGELAALCVVDAVARLVPGVLGNAESASTESFEANLLEHPQYTRPVEFRGLRVPEVLQGGDHARIARWRRWHALKLTQERRPDLFAKLTLSAADRKLLALTDADL